jgi:HSP20 family protein
MTLMRRGSRRSLSPFGEDLEWLLDDPWQALDRLSRQAAPSVPSVDVRETEDAYVVKAELPGMKPEDAEVTLDDRTLVIRGKFGEEEESEREGGRWIVRERRAGSYARAISLPTTIDADKIESSFENGELKITLPKAQESRARRIPIGGGAGAARSVGAGEGRTAGQGEQGQEQPDGAGDGSAKQPEATPGG